MRSSSPALAVLALLVPALAGCITPGASLGASGVPQLTPRTQALRGSIAPIASIPLSARAELAALDAEYQALQFGTVGQAVRWEADGVVGEFVPTQLYRVGSQDCRGFTHTITKGGSKARQVGSACRSGDDLWTPVA